MFSCIKENGREIEREKKKNTRVVLLVVEDEKSDREKRINNICHSSSATMKINELFCIPDVVDFSLADRTREGENRTEKTRWSRMAASTS